MSLSKHKDKIESILAYSKDFLSYIPQNKDNHVTKVVKILGAISTLLKLSNEIGSMSLHKKNMINNRQFIHTFFNSPLQEPFRISKKKLTTFSWLVTASHPEFGSLYFKEYRFSGEVDHSSTFWHSPDFKFEELLQKMWQSYKEKIHIEFSEDRYRRLRTHYSKIIFDDSLLLGTKHQDKMKELTDLDTKYREDNVPRTYLLYGPPGTGKSTFALHFASQTNAKVMRLDASGLTSARTSDLEFILKNIQPEVLIVDDIDRSSNLETTLPTLFHTLTSFKEKFKQMVVILTANDISKLDTALIRPGRVEELIEFGKPDKQERTEILNGFLEDFNLELNKKDFDKIVKLCDGLTHAYIREIAMQLKYRTIDNAVQNLSHHKKIILQKEGDHDKNKDEN